MFKKPVMIAVWVIFPLMVGLACNFSAANTPATAEGEDIVPIEAVEETTVPTPEEQTAPEDSAAEASGPQDLIMLEKSLWVQRETTVFVSFFFENPNSDVVFEDVEYTVYLYDANGGEIDSDTSTIRWIFPNQTFGIVFNFYLSDESVTVDSVSVDWAFASTTGSDGFANPFTVSNAVYWQNGDYPIVTGMINSNDADTYTDIRANIICYNAAGEIVGGGYTLVDFVPGNDYMGFATYVDTFDTVATVEVFPTFSYSTLQFEGTDFWSDISILNDHFYPSDYGGLIGGLEIKSNVNTVLENSTVYVTFYDADGNITATGTDTIDILLPKTTLGVMPWVLTPPDGSESVNYDIFILPGEYVNDYEIIENPFTVNNATLTGEYSEYVAVSFTNTYTKQVSEVDISVLLLDAEGNIIGGGTDWTTEPTPAGGTSEIEVWVDYAKTREVDSIKVWVTPNYWTEYE